MRVSALETSSKVPAASNHLSGNRQRLFARVPSTPIAMSDATLLQGKSACACGGRCPQCAQRKDIETEVSHSHRAPETEATRTDDELHRFGRRATLASKRDGEGRTPWRATVDRAVTSFAGAGAAA